MHFYCVTMPLRIFHKNVFHFKGNSNIFLKCSRCIHYVSVTSTQNVCRNLFANSKVSRECFISNKKLLNTLSVPSYIQTHSELSKGSLLYNNNIIANNRISIGHNPIAVNSIRHYSNLPPLIINDAIQYNNGIFQIISESAPVEWTTQILRLVHYEIGLPWWATIIVTTMAARILINLPLTILDLQNTAKAEKLHKELAAAAKQIKMEVHMEAATSELSPSRALALYRHALTKERNEFYERENYHPLKGFAILLLQAPVWISISVAIRNICFTLPQRTPATLQDYFEFTNGGFGWMQNLILPDPLFALPIIFCLSGLFILEVNQIMFNVHQTRLYKIMRNVSRGIIIVFLPITACIPSSLTLYWLTNNSCSIAQNLLFLSPKVRRVVGIPKTSSEIQHPYTELYNRMLNKIRFKKSVEIVKQK